MKSIVSIIMMMVLSIGWAQNQQNNWVKKASYGGDKRERAVGFSIAGKGYVCSGQDTLNLVTNDLWQYDPASNSWSQRANMPGVGRRNAVAFTIGNKGYVGTGMSAANSSAGNTLSDFWAYDPSTNSWSAIAPYPGGFGSGIYFATAFVLDEKAYVCCGKVDPSNYIDELWEYKPLTDQWSQRAPFPGGDRYQLTSFISNGRAYIGLGTDENQYTNDLYEYLPATNGWVQKNNFPGAERSSVSSFTLNDNGFITCGGDGGYLNDLWEYHSNSDTWSLRTPFSGDERRNCFSFVINNRAYVGGGKGYTGVRRSMYEYTPMDPVGINEFELTVTTYPNPCTSHVNIVSDQVFDAIEIINLSGQTVKSIATQNSLKADISMEDISAGNYLIKVTNKDQSKIAQARIIKL